MIPDIAPALKTWMPLPGMGGETEKVHRPRHPPPRGECGCHQLTYLRSDFAGANGRLRRTILVRCPRTGKWPASRKARHVKGLLTRLQVQKSKMFFRGRNRAPSETKR